MSVCFQLPSDLFFQYFIHMLVKGVDRIGQICLNEDSTMFSSEFFPHGNHYVLALCYVVLFQTKWWLLLCQIKMKNVRVQGTT